MRLLKDFKKQKREIAYLSFSINDLTLKERCRANNLDNHLNINYHGWSDEKNKIETLENMGNIVVKCNLLESHEKRYYNLIKTLWGVWGVMYDYNKTNANFNTVRMGVALDDELDHIEAEIGAIYDKTNAKDEYEYCMYLLLHSDYRIEAEV